MCLLKDSKFRFFDKSLNIKPEDLTKDILDSEREILIAKREIRLYNAVKKDKMNKAEAKLKLDRINEINELMQNPLMN